MVTDAAVAVLEFEDTGLLFKSDCPWLRFAAFKGGGGLAGNVETSSDEFRLIVEGFGAGVSSGGWR